MRGSAWLRWVEDEDGRPVGSEGFSEPRTFRSMPTAAITATTPPGGERSWTPVRRLRVSKSDPEGPLPPTVHQPTRCRRRCAAATPDCWPLRLLNRRIGQPRLAATAASLAGGVRGPGVADQVHQRDVLVAVGVER